LEVQVSSGQAAVPQVVDDGRGVSVHEAVPLHVRVMHAVEVQVRPVPWHVPSEQTSLYVQAFPSLHAAAVRQAQVPPALVQVYDVPPQVAVWQAVTAPHVVDVPALHAPLARLAPQP
jgi:hypothetical protein